MKSIKKILSNFNKTFKTYTRYYEKKKKFREPKGHNLKLH